MPSRGILGRRRRSCCRWELLLASLSAQRVCAGGVAAGRARRSRATIATTSREPFASSGRRDALGRRGDDRARLRCGTHSRRQPRRPALRGRRPQYARRGAIRIARQHLFMRAQPAGSRYRDRARIGGSPRVHDHVRVGSHCVRSTRSSPGRIPPCAAAYALARRVSEQLLLVRCSPRRTSPPAPHRSSRPKWRAIRCGARTGASPCFCSVARKMSRDRRWRRRRCMPRRCSRPTARSAWNARIRASYAGVGRRGVVGAAMIRRAVPTLRSRRNCCRFAGTRRCASGPTACANCGATPKPTTFCPANAIVTTSTPRGQRSHGYDSWPDLRFRNPIVLASGTAGYGREIDDVVDLARHRRICRRKR